MACTVEKYKAYREVDRKLHSKLMNKGLLSEVMMKAGKLLRIVREKTFIFESTSEMNAVTDLALHEYRERGKTGIERYREEVGGQDEVEKEILDAYIASCASLFRVIAISGSDRTLLLRDLLGKRGEVKLTDIHLSETAVVGILLFLRVVPLADFNMTSGVMFAFPGGRDDYLLKKYRKLGAKAPSDVDAMKRFIAFFWLNRTEGVEVGYKE